MLSASSIIVPWQTATYIKSLARKASLAESSTKAAKAYKAKVASLTCERVELRAWIQSLTDDVLGYKSNLKHTSTVKTRAEDREKKAIEGLRVVEDELRVVKEEFQAAKEELCTKAAALDLARREASEVESSLEPLAEECHALRGDLHRREAMVSQRDGVIAELRDEPCTLWASGWLAFRCRAAKAFPGLNFNFQVPDEEEAKESVYEDEAYPGVFSDTPSSVPFPGEVKVPAEAGSSLSLTGASPSDLHGLEARTTEAACSSTPNI